MKDSSYGSILKSSTLIGGSQFITLAVGLLQTKFAAVFLGPTGFGLIGTYLAIQQFVVTLSGLGIGNSAVRDIAEARSSEDARRVGRSAIVVRRLSFGLGVIGALLLLLLAWPLSRLTFGDGSHLVEISGLGGAVFLGIITAAQKALLQGFRRITDMAKASVLAALVGVAPVVLWYYLLGARGIVPALVTLAVINLGFSWWYARQLPIPGAAVSSGELLRHASCLLGLGLAFMWSGLLVAGMSYAVRLIVLWEFDLAGVGIYAAAYSISGMLVSFILQAMSADYFPRLSGVSGDHPRMVRLVNEQAEIGILLALPAIVALLFFSELLVKTFFTNDFLAATGLIQWFALGAFVRVFQWPLGFVILAKKRGVLFAGIQTFYHIIHLCLIFIGIHLIGLEGVAVAYAGLYAVTCGIAYGIANSLISFRWSPQTFRLLVLAVGIVSLSLVIGRQAPGWWPLGLGICVVPVVGLSCLRGLLWRLGPSGRVNVLLAKYLPLTQRFLAA